ncbi:MAG: hypothetical protein Q8R53_02005 [Nanoarchaeota archaeon]|nr:hypothetical protein [Nanoarchaeota archaeon]
MDKKRCSAASRTSRSPLYPPQSNKKGQVTVFIILGILLLMAVVLVIVFRKEIVQFKPEEVLPTERGKVQQFITACLETLGNEAVARAGQQGGYVQVPEEIATAANLHLKTAPFLLVPFWAYGETLRIPSLEEVEEGLDGHIERGLRECLLGTTAFQERYDLLERSPITAETQATNEKVLFNVLWVVEIRDKAGNFITELREHSADSDVKLKNAYDVARRIVEREMREVKFEDLTQDLLALESPNVPLSGLEVGCTQKTWRISDVKAALQELLRVNIGQVRIEGTDVLEFPEGFPYYENHYSWNLGDDLREPKVSVVFRYSPTFPFAFDVRPRGGTTLRSSPLGSNNELVSFFCLQTWKFVYDVSYPVLVELRDETTGYTFKTAFTVHLNNNLPDRSAAAAPETTLFFDAVNDEEYCQESQKVLMAAFTYSLVDNDRGVYNAEPLEDVDLRFTCIRYECPIGKTEYDFAGLGDVAAYRTNFPYCVGGILRGTRDGYKESWKRVVTAPGRETELYLAPLFPFSPANMQVLKHQVDDSGRIRTTAPLEEGEKALVKLSFTKANELEPFHEQTFVIDPAAQEISSKQDVQLLAEADFTYDLEVLIFAEGTFVSGYQGKWTPPWRDLQQAQEIIFHTASAEELDDEERLLFFAALEEKSSGVAAPEMGMEQRTGGAS